MRPDKPHLAVALGIVAHRGDGEIDLVVRQQWNAAGGVDAGELGRDAQAFGHGAADIDIIANAFLAFARAEQRIVFAHADADLAGAIEPDESIDTRLATGPGHGCGSARL